MSKKDELKQLFDLTLDVLCIAGTDGFFKLLNPAFERITGYTAEELKRRPFTAYVHPEDQAETLAEVAQLIKGAPTVCFENRYRCKDGTYKWLAWTAAPDPASGLLYATARDVTEQKHIQAALLHSKKRLQALMDSVQDAIITADAAGHITDWSEGAARMFGYTPAEIMGQSLTQLMPESYGEAHRSGLARYNATGMARVIGQALELEGLRKNGEVFPIELVLSTWEDQGATYFSAVVRDTTERKRAEAERKSSERKFRDLFDHSPDAIFVEDLDGYVLDANESAGRLHGMTRDELVGKHVLELVPPAHRPEVAQAFQNLAAGTVTYAEGWSWHKEGRPVPVEIRSRPVVLQDRPAVLLHVRDLSQRKKAEEQLHRTMAENQALLDVLPDSMVRLAKDGTYLDVRLPKNFEAFQPVDQLLGHSAFDLLPPDVAGQAKACVDRVLETGELHSFEYAVEVNGERRYREARVVLCGEDEVLSIMRDITKRKAAEKALHTSRQQLRELALHLQTARENERTRLSREVHDVLGQALTALRMDVSWCQNRLTPDQWTTLDERLESMKQQIAETIQVVRRIARDLRPGILDDLGLVAALEWQAHEYQARTGITCRVNSQTLEDIDIEPERATTVFRIFQELLTNVSRHADASEVEITLLLNDAELCLIVKDNGKGIRPEDLAQKKSLGLLGMRERAMVWGGTVAFEGTPGQGTCATVRLPLTPATTA